MTVNFVPYFAWAGAEIAVAMICLGIPTLRPLYLKRRGIPVEYGHQVERHASELPQFTMCEPGPMLGPPAKCESIASSYITSDDGPAKPESAHSKHVRGHNDSVDEILGLYDNNGCVIWVKNEVKVDWASTMNWPLRS